MPRALKQRQEQWKSGEVTAPEPQRIPLHALKLIENWDTVLDQALESAPGYEEEFSISRSRQLATMEDDETWTNATANTAANQREYGFQSFEQIHGGGGTITSTFTRALGFIGADFVDADIMHFWFRHTVLANVTTVEVRFRNDITDTDYFSRTFTLTGADPDTTTFDVARSTFSATGSPSWSSIIDVQVIVTVSAAVTVSFDNFRISVTDATIQDPSTGILGFNQIANSERFLMVSNSDGIFSAEGSVLTRRDSKLTKDRMVHMIPANDQVFAVNGGDNPRNWVTSENTFRDVGVPAPTGTPVGAEGGAGNVQSGTYFAKVVFDMGVHGEGNGSPASSGIVIATDDKAIDYTSIPIGPARTIQRSIYRTNQGVSAVGPYFLDETIPNNTDTTITSTNSDAQLGRQLVEDANKPPAGNYIEFANNLLFMAGMPTAQSAVRYSDITKAANRTIEQWPALNEFQLNKDDGDRITGMIYHERFIYVFKTRSTWIIDPRTLAAPIQISPIHGTVSQRSLRVEGGVLYAWSGFTGPLEIRGQDIRPIGRAEKNRKRNDPGVLDVNTNPISSTLNGIIISTQADFKAGVSTFSNTTADEQAGKIILTRVAGKAPTVKTEDQSTLNSSSISSDITSASLFLTTEANIGNATDGDVLTFYRISQDNTKLAKITGTIEIDLGTLKDINRVQLLLGLERGSNPLFFADKNANSLQYLNAANSWVTLQDFAWPSAATSRPDFLRSFFPPPHVIAPKPMTIEFNTVEAQKFRISIDINIPFDQAIAPGGFTSPLFQLALTIHEFRIFQAGFEPVGSWTSDKLDLGSVPDTWGRLTSDFEVPNGTTITIKMRSAASAIGLDSELFTVQTPGAAPTVAENSFVQFQVEFTSQGGRTPSLEDLALTFLAAAKGIIQPQFESCGIFFEDRYWLNTVKRDAQKPATMWKYDTVNRAFSRHTDYAMSDWDLLGTDLFSCSCEDGSVFRHVIDAARNHIGAKDGRVIPCVIETADSAYGDQSTSHSLRDFTIAARNEAENRVNFITNPTLENWTADVPDGWSVTGDNNIFGENRVFQEIDPRNTLHGDSSARLDFRAPSAGALTLDVVIPGLLNDTDYILIFHTKSKDQSPSILQLQASTPPGAPVFLQDDGTWGAASNQLAAGFAFLDSVDKNTLAFRTPSNIESFSEVKLSFGFALNSLRGTLWVDSVALYEASTITSRLLKIQPILNDQDFGPEQTMNLIGGDQSTIDLGIREERFRMDSALNNNGRLRITHQEPEARAKLLGIFISHAPEKFRSPESIRS